MRKRFNVLSLDGGGYLGLATAVFIAETERHFQIKFHEKFDLFCGTSTGSIIALALAAGMSGDDIVELYRNMGGKVFKAQNKVWRFFLFLKGFVYSKYGSSHLRLALEEGFHKTGLHLLGDIKRKNKFILIPSYSVSNGHPRIFKTDHSGNLTCDDNKKIVEVALASCSAPTYFPISKLKSNNGTEEYFCDGGVFANHPALLGFAEALYELKKSPGDVALLSISTPRISLNKGMLWWTHRGVLQWAKTIFSVFMDGNSITTHEVLERITKVFPEPEPKYVRIELQNPESIPMDLASARSRRALESIGNQEANKNGTRDKLKRFFEEEG